MSKQRQPMKFSGLVASGKITPKIDLSTTQEYASALESGEERRSREAAVAAEEASAVTSTVGREALINVDLLDDSPFQYRKKYDPVKIAELAGSMLEAGQRTPITVRIVQAGRYEVIKGHSRKYAAKHGLIPQLSALVVERTDREAKLDCMLDNEVEGVCEYEHALMYRDALKDGYASNQSQVARLFRCSQPKVSNCLSMLDLPEPVLEMLDADPGLIGAKAAKVVTAMWKEQPSSHHLILEALARVQAGADQATIKGWVAQKLASIKNTEPKKLVRHFITTTTGDARYVTLAKERDIVIRLADTSLDRDEIHQKVDDFLRRLATEGGA
ncbi:ParB/RepB/Spo0J family partition protein [Massilia antarctica]